MIPKSGYRFFGKDHAFFVLRERFGLWRWVAVALMLAGMLLMRL